MLGCTNISAGQSQLELIERRLRSVHKKVNPAIVRIVHGEDKEREWHFGSGVIMTADGYVATRSSSRTISKGAPNGFLFGRRSPARSQGIQ